MMKIVATTSLPSVDRPNAEPLERRTLAPKILLNILADINIKQQHLG